MHRGVWINNSIELTEPIAEGAMGRVWIGYHHRMQTHVAVKFVSEKLGDDTAEAFARFEREASVASQIKSPHVVQTFDSGLTHDGIPYIVMELLHGKTLGERLRRVGRIDLPEAAMVLEHTARGLTDAHAQGIIHRDVKPDNIFMCRTEQGTICKLLDFGIAKQTCLPAMGGLTTDGKMVGTPEYMSPEMVLEDRAVDYRVDLWALGVVMYQALTGHLPFTGATLGQLCLNLVGKKPPRATDYRHDLPPRLNTWFARTLNRDAQMRFTSATQMAESFATLEDDAAFHTIPPLLENTERNLSSSHTLRDAKLRKTNTLVTAAGVAAAVAVLGGGSWLAVQPPTPVTILAQQAIEPMVNQVAARAVKGAGSTPATATATATAKSSAPDSSATSEQPKAPSVPTPRRPLPIVKPQPAPPATPAPASGKRRRNRTPGSVGF